jgi:ubiquinone/menaquinone biosynthesis C-methylase UbiE
VDSIQEHTIRTYRDRARHYDVTGNLYYLLGFRVWASRRRAVQALGLHRADTVVEIGCGTGLNFSLVEQAIGPGGRIIGVDLTDAMLAQAERRVQARGWQNVTLVQADAAGFEFPAGVNAIFSTYALSLVPACAEVIAHGCTALAPGGHMAVLDLKVPPRAPRWLVRAGLATVKPFALTDKWMVRRPWKAIRDAMQDRLAGFSWDEFYFGVAYLAAGTRADFAPDSAPGGPVPG